MRYAMKTRRHSAASATGAGIRISPERSHLKNDHRRRNTRVRKVSGVAGASHVRSIDLNSSSVMACTPEGLQHSAQIVAGAVQSRFHGPDLFRDRIGRSFERQAFVLDQDQHFALKGR